MNVGIIGCGAISSQYMIGLKKNKKEINLLACADKDENKSEFFAKEYNTLSFFSEIIIKLFLFFFKIFRRERFVKVSMVFPDLEIIIKSVSLLFFVFSKLEIILLSKLLKK